MINKNKIDEEICIEMTKSVCMETGGIINLNCRKYAVFLKTRGVAQLV